MPSQEEQEIVSTGMAARSAVHATSSSESFRSHTLVCDYKGSSLGLRPIWPPYYGVVVSVQWPASLIHWNKIIIVCTLGATLEIVIYI